MKILENGLRVVNFSSPHDFNFDDGSILAGLPADEVNRLSLDRDEIVLTEKTSRGVDLVSVNMVFKLTDAINKKLDVLENDPDVDIILVPFPMLSALSTSRGVGKARSVVMVDRVSKIASSHKFSIL